MKKINFTSASEILFKILKWIVLSFFITGGLLNISKNSPLGSLLIIFSGILLIPLISEKIKLNFSFWKNNIIRRGTITAFALIGFIIIGKQIKPQKNQIKNDEIVVENPKIPSKNKVRIINKVRTINLDKVYFDENGNKVKPDNNDITYRVVEVLDHQKTEAPEKKFNYENFHLLVKFSSYEKEDLEKIAFSIKDEYAQFAPNNCNIELWDDKKAYLLYLEQQKYYNQSFDELMIEFKRTRMPIGDKHAKLKKQWDKINYPFIADHLPASISLGNVFFYYQLQDNYYKEVGGKNYKK